MPLVESDSPKAIAENIRTEMEAGKSYDQALAIALNTADKAKKKREEKKKPKKN